MTAPRAPANRAELIDLIESSLWGGIPRLRREIARAGSNLAQQQAVCSRDARAILAALEAAGVRLVPAEATEEMRRAVAVNWGRRTWQEFADVVAANPYAPEGGV